MTAPSTSQTMSRVVDAHAPTEASVWLRARVDRKVLTRATFFHAYAGVGRRFSTEATAQEDIHVRALLQAGLIAPQAWSIADLARGFLLLAICAHLPSEEHDQLVREVFRTGDNHERVALLRSLCLLPQPERFVETAIEACRTHVQDVFEAIACDNSFPATHFPTLNFHQLVMKALFTQAPLSRVHNWQTRVDSELQRMASDFAAERSAAGRSIPSDVGLILQGAAR